MAEYRGAARVNQQPGQPANVLLFPDPDPDPDRRDQQLCLDAGRALLLCGAVVTIATPFDFGPANAKDNSRPAAANTTLVAFVGFLLWILGACLCLLALTPAAPWVLRAGAAVASTVLKCLCPPVPVNY